jgi:hypothetical protein
MFLLVIILAVAYGVGLGMAIAVWQMAAEPCNEPQPLAQVDEELELKKSA